mmetsp:Transcript_3790/g.8154  ORF Transcript_3790/g.8154 Transcript_3790/m.8154 type:complete len:216 (+) Transcript_3790:214-861(+)
MYRRRLRLIHPPGTLPLQCGPCFWRRRVATRLSDTAEIAGRDSTAPTRPSSMETRTAARKPLGSRTAAASRRSPAQLGPEAPPEHPCVPRIAARPAPSSHGSRAVHRRTAAGRRAHRCCPCKPTRTCPSHSTCSDRRLCSTPWLARRGVPCADARGPESPGSQCMRGQPRTPVGPWTPWWRRQPETSAPLARPAAAPVGQPRLEGSPWPRTGPSP